MPKPATTVEQTGKRFKAQFLFGGLLFWAGVAWVAVTLRQGVVDPWAAGLIALGTVVYTQAKARAWWHHG